MSSALPRLPRSAPHLALLVVVAALGACSGDVNPVRDAFVATGVGAEPPKAPDFVSRTRPRRDDLDYKPVAVTPTPRPLRSKTQGEVSAAEAEMDAARSLNEQSAAAANAPVAPAAAPPAAPAPQAAPQAVPQARRGN